MNLQLNSMGSMRRNGPSYQQPYVTPEERRSREGMGSYTDGRNNSMNRNDRGR